MSEPVFDRIDTWRAATATALLLALLLAQDAAGDATRADPTRPPLQRVNPVSGAPQIEARAPLSLTAVFFAEGKRIAIVNGRRVGPGDVVQDARVIAIERGRVVLIRDDTRLELELVGDVKRPSGRPAGPAVDRTEETPRVPPAAREGSPS